MKTDIPLLNCDPYDFFALNTCVVTSLVVLLPLVCKVPSPGTVRLVCIPKRLPTSPIQLRSIIGQAMPDFLDNHLLCKLFPLVYKYIPYMYPENLAWIHSWWT